MSRGLANYENQLSHPSPFWLERRNLFRSSMVTILTQVQMPSPYPLSSTHPDQISRRKLLSRFTSRATCSSLHCPDRSLFRPVDSCSGMQGHLHLFVITPPKATSCRTITFIIGSTLSNSARAFRGFSIRN